MAKSIGGTALDNVEQLLADLETRTETSDRGEQIDIIRELIKTGDYRIFEPLGNRLSGADEFTQTSVIDFLKTIDPYKAIPFLDAIQHKVIGTFYIMVEGALIRIKRKMRSAKRKQARKKGSVNGYPAQLAKGLYDWLRRVRPSVVKALAATYDAQAVPHLIDALLLGNKRARRYAVSGLAQIGGKGVAAHLIPLLAHKDSVLSSAAQKGLLKLCKDNTQPLIDQLQIMGTSVREKMLDILLQLDSAEAIPFLIEDLSSADERICSYAAQQLIQCPAPLLTRFLVNPGTWHTVNPGTGLEFSLDAGLMFSLETGSIRHRIYALRVLSQCRHPKVLKHFFKYLASANPKIYQLAVDTLSDRREETIKLLPEAVKYEDKLVRAGIARILGHFSPTQKELVVLVKDSEPIVRLQAVTSLAAFIDKLTLPLLSAAVNDSDKAVRHEAVKGLDWLMAPDVLEPLLHALKDEDNAVRITAIIALGRLGEKKAADSIAEFLNDDDTDTREKAVFALAGLKDTRAVKPLIQLIENSVENAAHILSRLMRSLPSIEKDALCEKCYCRSIKNNTMPLLIRELIGNLNQFLFISYHSCRKCDSNLHLLEGISTVILLMDHDFSRTVRHREDVIEINWYKWEGLFDFEEVRIIHADDYDVEKLVMTLNNDMDEYRRENLAHVPVYLSPALNLSPAKLNLLKDTFLFIETGETNG